ncbi:unnamed protein product, partial [Polarella glacialis]
AKALQTRLNVLRTADGANVLTNLSIAYAESGDLKAALGASEEAWRVRDLTSTMNSSEGAALLLNVGGLRLALEDLGGASAALAGAKDIRERCGSLETVAGAELLRSIGLVCFAQGASEDALQRFGEARALLLRLGALETPGGVELLRSIGLVRFRQGLLDAAIASYTEALEMCKGSESSALLLTNLGVASREMKDDAGAVKALNEAAEVYVRLGLAKSPEAKALDRIRSQVRPRVSDPRVEQTSIMSDKAIAKWAAELTKLAVERGQGVQLRRSLGSEQGGLENLEGARLLASLGAARGSAGDVDGAIEALDSAAKIFAALGGDVARGLEAAELLRNLGFARGLRGDAAGELGDYEQ